MTTIEIDDRTPTSYDKNNMTSITVSEETNEALNEMVRRGEASDPADAIRQALAQIAENRFYEEIKQARKDIREGRGVEGDLREIIANMPA